MSRDPRVSLGVPLYNAERYLEGCLDALLAQDYPDLEIVICDNASTDRTWEICQRYAARDPRIRLHRNPVNLGGPANYARVAALARGELFKWVAYDDLCAPQYVSSCVAALDAAGPRAILAYPRTVLIDGSGAEIAPYADNFDLRDHRRARRVARATRSLNLCHAHFGVHRLEALRRTGLIRPYPGSDYTLLVELAALGEIHEVDRVLFRRRIHAGSTVQGKKAGLGGAVGWFHPGGRRGRAPRLRMVGETVRALLTRDLPAPARLGCTVAFLRVWSARRTRVRLGRWRRRLTGRPLPPAPWETRPAQT